MASFSGDASGERCAGDAAGVACCASRSRASDERARASDEGSCAGAAIRASKARLVDFHVADNNRFAAGLGDLDWKKIVATLREVGY
ncbi:MAG TPA: hypothetical protein PK177_17730, partial [Burkholderiaceae bacterium]|nr:hypothetical protein [Burkholderiaceae bacterium]